MHTDNSSEHQREPDPTALHLLDHAFQLPNNFRFVANFLFQEGDIADVCAISSGIQKASAVTLHITQNDSTQFQSPSSHTDHEHMVEKVALIPLFSKDHITLGVQVSQILTPHSQNITPNSVFCGRFAFDTDNTSLLVVACFPVDGLIYITHISHRIVEGKRRLLFALNAAQFDVLKTEKRTTPKHLFTVVRYYDVHEEDRQSCIICAQPASGHCQCSLNTKQPLHPLDYSTLAPNMVLLSGTFTGTRRRWRRGKNGRPNESIRHNSTCKIRAHVDHQSVIDLCQLNKANVAKRAAQRRLAGEDEIQPSVSPRNTPVFSQSQAAERARSSASVSPFSLVGSAPNYNFGMSSFHSFPQTAFMTLPDLCDEALMGGSDEQELTQDVFITEPLALQGRARGNVRETMDASTSLRKIRNREAAARSNQKRKENLEILVRDLEAMKARLEVLKEREETLKENNRELKEKLGFL